MTPNSYRLYSKAAAAAAAAVIDSCDIGRSSLRAEEADHRVHPHSAPGSNFSPFSQRLRSTSPPLPCPSLPSFLPSLRSKKGSPYSITERRVPELIPVLGSQPAGCHYFPPGLQLPPQPLRGLLPMLLLGEHRHDGCEQFA